MINNFFYSLFNFVAAALFILIGIVSLLMPWFPGIRTELVRFILEDFSMILILGSVFLLLGLIMIASTLLSLKRRYHRIRSNSRSILVDEAVFQQYLDVYWKQLFPQDAVPSHVLISPKKLRITADLPYVPKSEQKDLLKRIHADLEELFSSYTGYQGDYLISISFQPKPKA